MMRTRPGRIQSLAVAGGALLALAATPGSARSQDLPLAQVLPTLILRDIVLQRGIGGPPHQAHFSPLTNEPNNPVVRIVENFNAQIATQFSTFPLGSSTSGLTYVFDESLGTFRRGSASFGPLFAERALTIGRRKLGIGFNYQRTSYDSFEQQTLENGSIRFYLRHQDCCTFRLLPQAPFSEFSSLQGDGSRLAPPFEGDIIEATLSLQATTHTTAVFVNYGMTDRWDVGLVVPFVRVDLDASVTARILRLVTCANAAAPGVCTPDGAPDIHTFEIGNPNATQTLQHSDNAGGLGDLVLRTKYRFLHAGGGGLAAAVDLRLPTGDERELIGTGGAQARLLLIASAARGRLGHHASIGYTIAEGKVPGTVDEVTSTPLPDEINYSAGIELIATPRVTVVGDIVGRTLRSFGRLDLVSKTFQYSDPSRLPLGFTPQSLVEQGILEFPTSSISLEEFEPRAGNLTLLLGTGGIKFNLAGNLLVSGSVLFPLTRAGLQSRLTTVVGIDYAF